MAWLAAGLGNPGERYATTRHNVGAMVVDLLASGAGERFHKARFVPIDIAEIHEGDEVIYLARSHRYMNESGPSYSSLAKKRHVEASNVIAIHDDIDLPFGSLKVKTGGSTAGHNGLRSLRSALGTSEFFRVRIGVGRPPGRQDPADFVLRPFAKAELAEIETLIQEAAGATLSLIAEGLATAQDRYNRTRD